VLSDGGHDGAGQLGRGAGAGQLDELPRVGLELAEQGARFRAAFEQALDVTPLPGRQFAIDAGGQQLEVTFGEHVSLPCRLVAQAGRLGCGDSLRVHPFQDFA
jgi:hypothetical protein